MVINRHYSRQIAIANLLLMIGVTIAWMAGVKGSAFIAVGTATFGFASLWPQYTSERGVWMLGGLVALFTIFAFFICTVDLLASDASRETTRSTFETFAIVTGMAILAVFLAFVTYASVVNYRMLRGSWPEK